MIPLQLRLGGPDLFLQPLHERRFLADATQQRHGRMGVGVHEARKQADFPFPVKHFVCTGSPVRSPDGRNPPALNKHGHVSCLLHHPVARENVLQQYGHVIPPSSSCRLPARASFRRGKSPATPAWPPSPHGRSPPEHRRAPAAACSSPGTQPIRAAGRSSGP